MRRSITTGTALVGTLLAGILAPLSGAAAHASLDHADPRVGSTVKASPAEVRVWFSEAVEPASVLRVLDQVGAPADQGNTGVDPGDHTLVKVSLRPLLSPGTYKVLWRASTADGATTVGSFGFTVAA